MLRLKLKVSKDQKIIEKNMKQTKNITKHRKRFLEETMGFSDFLRSVC